MPRLLAKTCPATSRRLRSTSTTIGVWVTSLSPAVVHQASNRSSKVAVLSNSIQWPGRQVDRLHPLVWTVLPPKQSYQHYRRTNSNSIVINTMFMFRNGKQIPLRLCLNLGCTVINQNKSANTFSATPPRKLSSRSHRVSFTLSDPYLQKAIQSSSSKTPPQAFDARVRSTSIS
jgi:hypothetical protein